MGIGISGGGPGMLGRAGGGFGPRGGPHGSFLGGSGGPGAMRMEKIHPHRFNPIGMGGGYVQSHFWWPSIVDDLVSKTAPATYLSSFNRRSSNDNCCRL